jgi:hypothetical protein
MSRTFGVAQASMRDTTITQEKGFLGHNSFRWKVGDTQLVTFTAGDNGLRRRNNMNNRRKNQTAETVKEAPRNSSIET